MTVNEMLVTEMVLQMVTKSKGMYIMFTDDQSFRQMGDWKKLFIRFLAPTNNSEVSEN